MAKKQTPAGARAPALEELAASYRIAQRRHRHSGIYRTDYYKLYSLIVDEELTDREIVGRLGLEPKYRRSILAVINRFFPFSERAARLAGYGFEGPSQRTIARRQAKKKAPVFFLLRQYLARVQLADELTPRSVHPLTCYVGGIRCSAVYTTTIHPTRTGQLYAYWPIPKTAVVDFLLFLVDIDDRDTPLREIFCIPSGDLPNRRYFSIRLDKRLRGSPRFDAEPFRGERGLLLLKQAVEAQKK